MEHGFQALFDGTPGSLRRWCHIGPNGFSLDEGRLVSAGDIEFGLLYYAVAAFDDYILRLDFCLSDPAVDNSGIFVRFRDPLLPLPRDLSRRVEGHDLQWNPAWKAVYSGFEVQIDEQARGNKEIGEPDGLGKNRTGAIYKIPAGDCGEARLQEFRAPSSLARGDWHFCEIEVTGDIYVVRLNGEQTTRFVNKDPLRGLPAKLDADSGYIGIQSYAGSRVAFRNIRIKRL